MTEIATIDWFGRWGTFVSAENTAIFISKLFIKNLLIIFFTVVVSTFVNQAVRLIITSHR